MCITTFKGFFCCASCLNNRCCIASCHSTTLLYSSPLFPSVAWHRNHGNREGKYGKNNQAGAEAAGLSHTMCTCCNAVSVASDCLIHAVSRCYCLQRGRLLYLERASRYVPLQLFWAYPVQSYTNNLQNVHFLKHCRA